jgi:hypothetical protein
MTSKAAPGLANLCDRLVNLWRRSPAQYRAFDRRVTAALVATRHGRKESQQDTENTSKSGSSTPFDRPARVPTPRTLQGRLQAVHDCGKDAGFTQLERSTSGPRTFRCEACGKVVTLEGGRS